jgi:hypothetical protein
MPLEGFEIRRDGPQSGLLWVTFSNIIVHGERNTPDWHEAMMSKAKLVDRVILTELRHGTKHYSKDGKLLKTAAAILLSYRTFGGYFVALPPNRQWKLDGLVKNEGIIIHDDSPAHQN